MLINFKEAKRKKKMGSNYSKLEDKDRIRIYKRIPLVEAREQFARLSPSEQKAEAFKHSPISRNFYIYLYDQRLTTFHFLDKEVDGSAKHRGSLVFSLQCDRPYVDTSIKAWKKLFVGLSKEQYDALFKIPS